MSYETQTCADCGRREPMDIPREVRFAGEYGPLCDGCLPLALRVVEANAANAPADPALLALAKFAADVIASHRSRTGKWAQPALLALPGIARDIGVTVRGQLAPGIADAIAALLAPAPADGAGEVAP